MNSHDRRIALMPLDDRPVNVLLPQDVANVAGVALDVPDASMLPRYREQGDTDALAAWLRERAADPSTTHLVVSIDMLLYGGLIASRTSQDSVREVVGRLDVLRDIKRERPELTIFAVSLVMRASNSYSNAEEPEYWKDYGKDLHVLGGALHQQLDSADVGDVDALAEVPDGVVTDYASRRVRNHVVNLNALLLRSEGTIDFLAITADDTATFAAGSAEQVWLRHWMRFLPGARDTLMYPGADEVGAALVARAIASADGIRPRFEARTAQEGGFDLVPPFENRPLIESVERQIRAAGAERVESGADIVLVLHAPDPARHDMFRGYPETPDVDAAEATVELVRRSLDGGSRVALADVRFPNGADAELLSRLAAAGLLERLEAFGGWNTAGNTIGSVVALAVAGEAGRASGAFDAEASKRALLTRLLDDYAYQTVIRSEKGADLFPDRFPLADEAHVENAQSVIRDDMNQMLRDTLPGGDWSVTSLTLPWRRSFEVAIALSRL
ncbi:DUF4127 family protein [Paramicrobacterium agarici]|uniref:DUF4127 family protein n=1 Tax=Paramicrobacterium agarici TaxID=630514 RepID=UPI00115287FE|nr:DUF4127 family protein [Microbacterium agarici]TQO22960.1 uncharacterized protein DUF4127 [Microbacterium agarici]